MTMKHIALAVMLALAAASAATTAVWADTDDGHQIVGTQAP